MRMVFENAIEEGRTEEYNEGKLQGKIEGVYEGIEIGKEEIAKRMFQLGKYTIEDIENVTGVSEEKIKELCNS